MSVDAKLRRAMKFAKAGDRSGAAQIYREVLARFPANAQARKGLAALSQQTVSAAAVAKAPSTSSDAAPWGAELNALQQAFAGGETSRVVAGAQQLVLKYPNLAPGHNLLGLALARSGRHRAALPRFDRALKADPTLAIAHHNKAASFAALGEMENAAAASFETIRLAPGYAEAHLSAAFALIALDRLEEAQARLNEAETRAPSQPGVLARAQLGKGNLAFIHGRYHAAAAHFAQAHELDPKNVEALTNLVLTQMALGRHEDAGRTARITVQLEPRNPRAWISLAQCQLETGARAKASESIDRALAIAPNHVEALALQGRISPPLPGTSEFNRQAALTQSNDLPALDRAHLGFVLFEAEDRAGDPERAFAWLAAANAMRRKAQPYDIANDRALVTAMQAAFPGNPALPKSLHRPPATPRPVFIVGMPRSGTSLVEQILAAHSQVDAGGEMTALGAAMQDLGWTPTQIGPAPNEKLLADLRADYFASLQLAETTRPVITDKLPLNFRWLGFALAAIPEARALVTVRDPRATCFSNFRTHFTGGGNNFGNDLGDLAEFYRLHLDLIEFWERRFPGRITRVPYEALTENQEVESRKLVAAAGLDWEPACLDFHDLDRAVHTASTEQVRQKMYTGSSEAWRRYEPFLGPMLEGLEGLA